MRILDTIQYYPVEVRYHENMIQIYDPISMRTIATEPYPREISSLLKKEHQTYLAMNKKKEILSEISISLDLISRKSKLQTEAGYILDLHMLSQSHGYFFGYYELGEFELTEQMTLKKLRSNPVQNCTSGRVSKSGDLYIGCREDEKYFLVKLNWKANENPKVSWKKELPTAAMLMEIIEDRLFIGLKSGNLQLWDLKKDELINEKSLFSSTISALLNNGKSIIFASKGGDIARVNDNGDIQWKSNITEEEVVGIYNEKAYLLVLSKRGKQFHININSGAKLQHRLSNLNLEGHDGLSSNIVKYRNRFVITGYGGIWVFERQTTSHSLYKYMSDPLMRILYQHPFGFYSGDDEGSVCFWTLSEPKIKVENYEPPLKNYQAYLKFNTLKKNLLEIERFLEKSYLISFNIPPSFAKRLDEIIAEAKSFNLDLLAKKAEDLKNKFIKR